MSVLFGVSQRGVQATAEKTSSACSIESWMSPVCAFGRGHVLKRSSSTGDEALCSAVTTADESEVEASSTNGVPAKTRGRAMRRADYIMKVFTCSSRLPRSTSPSPTSAKVKQAEPPSRAGLFFALGSAVERLHSRQRPKKKPGDLKEVRCHCTARQDQKPQHSDADASQEQGNPAQKRAAPLDTSSLDPVLPDSELILQDLERCRMQLEDTWKPPRTSAAEAKVPTSSRCSPQALPPAPATAAPSPEQLPSPGLRLLSSASLPVLQRSCSPQQETCSISRRRGSFQPLGRQQRALSTGVAPTSCNQHRMMILQADKQLQLAIEAVDAASSTWPNLHTPSVRTLSELEQEQVFSWSDVKTSVGCFRADARTARGDGRRRASTTDSVTRASGLHLREAQVLFSQMLEANAPGTSACFQEAKSGCAPATNRRWHRAQRPSSASSACGVREMSLKDEDVLKPLNGSVPWFPGLQAVNTKLHTPSSGPNKDAPARMPIAQEQPEKELSPGEERRSEAGTSNAADVAFCKLLAAALSEQSMSSPTLGSVPLESRFSADSVGKASPPSRQPGSAAVKAVSPKSAATSPQSGIAHVFKSPRKMTRPIDFGDAFTLRRRTEDKE